jgi:hypothetical protein
MQYLEHGKFFGSGKIPSDFNELAYTSGMSLHSKDLRDTLGLDLRTQFSESAGNISFAFVPLQGKTHFAFVQFQSRFENEFGGSSTNRPFFQTRFLSTSLDEWRSLFEDGLSVFPSLVQFRDNVVAPLENFTTVNGNVGDSLPIRFLDSSNENNLFFRYSTNRNKNTIDRISVIANALINNLGYGSINLVYDVSVNEKLILIDSLMHTLLPILKEPFSFSFDQACTSKVNVQFGANSRNLAAMIDLNNESVSELNTNSNIQEFVNFIANDTNNWVVNQKLLFSSFPKVVLLRNEHKPKEALLFLLSYLKGNFSELFLRTSGQYDDEIVPGFSADDIQRVFKYGQDETRIRLLSNMLFHKPNLESWFEYLLEANINPSRLKNIIAQYLEINFYQFGDICEYFGNLDRERQNLFLINLNQNVLYESLKKYYFNYLQNFTQTPIIDKDNQKENDLDKSVINVLKGIKKLPAAYEQIEETWFWIRPILLRLYKEDKSIGKIFSRLNMHPIDNSSLFYRSVIELHIPSEEITRSDIKIIDSFTEGKKNDNQRLNENIENPPSELPKNGYNHTDASSSKPESVFVLPQARIEFDHRALEMLQNKSRENHPFSFRKKNQKHNLLITDGFQRVYPQMQQPNNPQYTYQKKGRNNGQIVSLSILVLFVVFCLMLVGLLITFKSLAHWIFF